MIQQYAADNRSYFATKDSKAPVQVAADDRSYAANVARSPVGMFGGSWMNQPSPVSTTTLAGKSPMGQEPPKFEVLKAIKDTELDPALSKNFAKAEASGKRSTTLFDNYMAQFNEAAAAEKGRLATEIGKYDSAASNFKRDLDVARAKEQQGFADDRMLGLRQILGNDERYSLGKGPLSVGRSGEQERMLADSFHDTRLRYDQRVREAEGRDIRDSYNALLSTAPLARNATQQYLASLTAPIGLSQSLQAGNTQNLGTAAREVMNNRDYMFYSDDPRLTPDLRTPSGQYRIPNVPDYGGRNPARQSGVGNNPLGGGGTSSGGGTTPIRRSAPVSGADPNWVQPTPRYQAPNSYVDPYTMNRVWDEATQNRLALENRRRSLRDYVDQGPPQFYPDQGPSYNPVYEGDYYSD